MDETILSVGIDIGTSTTQLIISRLTLVNQAAPFTVPRIAITDKEILYRSKIHFTPSSTTASCSWTTPTSCAWAAWSGAPR